MKFLLPALILTSSFTQAADLSITEARVRAVPPTAKISAAFMNIENRGADAVSMISATSSIAESVELHTNNMTDGKMTMRQVEQIELAGKQMTELAPGGLHIMLIGLKKPLKEGEMVDLSIKLSDGTTELFELPIQQIMPHMKH